VRAFCFIVTLTAAIAAAPTVQGAQSSGQQPSATQTPPSGQQPPSTQPAPTGQQPPATQPAPAGQQPPSTQPPSGQQSSTPGGQAAQPNPRSFSSDAGMFFNNVRPDKTADFEMIMGRVKDALAKNPDPVRKQQAASWKVYKSVEPGAPLADGGRAVLYIFVMDPTVKNADYTITKILAEAFPSEVQDLYNKLVACYPAQSGQSIVNLHAVLNMAGTAGSGGK
jgi:hypothetical protein